MKRNDLKDILFEIHSILATLVMNPNNYSEELAEKTNKLLENIYQFIEK